MIHDLGSTPGRSVYITWEIDWVPETTPGRTDIVDTQIQWLDVAGKHLYPVFDAERGFDRNGDGKYVFPDEVPTSPAEPGYEERKNVSDTHRWVVPAPGATLVFGAGHLHPGGLSVDLRVARDGPDAGTADGDDPAEVRKLFHSGARYYEPAGAVSWDVSMEATRKNWRISLEPGDTVSINTTYKVKRASWYESMGILPLAWTKADDPAAQRPVQRRRRSRGDVRQGRHPHPRTAAREHRSQGPQRPEPPRPARPARRRAGPEGGVGIRSFYFLDGGFSVVRGFPASEMRPPVIRDGETVTFTNFDAQPGQPQTEQAWHSITSCRAPCNRGSGIGYPLANGPIKFDSGQLGYGTGTSAGVTTQSDTFTTPPLKAGKKNEAKTYTYFCRIHPFMRGSVRVKK